MAIGTNDHIEKFGTTDEVINVAGTTVSNDAFSDSGDMTAWTNDDDAVIATAILDATMGVSPTAGSTIDLYVRLLNISDTTQDQNVPSSTFSQVYLGSFGMDSGGTAQISAIEIGLPNAQTSQQYEFYFFNNGTGTTVAVGSTVDVVPKAIGPSA